MTDSDLIKLDARWTIRTFQFNRPDDMPVETVTTQQQKTFPPPLYGRRIGSHLSRVIAAQGPDTVLL
jgi:hypothetical protein